MRSPCPQKLLNQSWPANKTQALNGFLYRDKAGGGRRTEAATALKLNISLDDIAAIEERFLAEKRGALFQVWEGETDFEALLNQQNYRHEDKTYCLSMPVDQFDAKFFPEISEHPAPTSEHKALWEQCDMSKHHFATMARVTHPKTSLVFRKNNIAQGACFAVIVDDHIVVHALFSKADQRNQGIGSALLKHAAQWGKKSKAKHISLFVEKENVVALGIYKKLGMKIIAHYHYRLKEL